MRAMTGVDPAALIADLQAIEPTAHRGRTCQTGSTLDQLPDDVRPTVAALIDRPDLSPNDVCTVLAKHDIHIQAQNLARHRRRGTPSGCRCPKSYGEADA